MTTPRLVVWAAEPINYARFPYSIGPTTSRSAGASASSTHLTNELQWTPIPWPSSWDVIAAAQEDPRDLPVEGAAGAPLYPPAGESQMEGLYSEHEDFTGFMRLLLEDLSTITVVVDDQWVYVISPPDADEVRGLYGEELEAYGGRLGEVEDEAGSLSSLSTTDPQASQAADRNVWTVWAVRIQDLLSEIQYHLLEPTIDGGVSWQFWTATEVRSYLADRVARWFMETCLIRRRTVSSVTTLASMDLDPTLALLQRVYSGGMLERASKMGLDKENPSWATETGTPQQYVDVSFNWASTPGAIRVYPAPTATREVSYVWVPTGVDSAAQQGDTLGIPATLSWGLKYGVMADMLNREGEGQDKERGAYCETRYKDSVALAKMLMGEEVKQGG